MKMSSVKFGCRGENWHDDSKSFLQRPVISWLKTEVLQILKKEFGGELLNSDKKKMQEMTSKSRPAILLMITAAFSTFISCTLNSWGHYYFLAKSKFFYLASFGETTMLFCFLYFVMNKHKGRSKQGILQRLGASKFSSAWLMVILHVVVTCVLNIDSGIPTTNGGGSDFYQVFTILTIPAVIICNNQISTSQIKGYVSTTLCCFVAVQLMIFCKDREFHSPVSTTFCSFIFAAVFGLYWVLLKGFLAKESILQLIYLLACVEIPLHLLMALVNGESDHLSTSLIFNLKNIVQSLAVCFLLMALNFLKMVTSLLLMKMADSLTCLVATNFSLVPFTLLKVFIFKRELYLSTFKCFFIFLFNFVFSFVTNRGMYIEEPISIGSYQ